MKVVLSILLSIFLLGACKNPRKQRSDAEAGSPVKEVVQPSQRPIDTGEPARAPEARILKVSSNGSVEILYDKVVPMTNVKKIDTSSKMQEGLIRPVTGVTYHEGSLYIAHRSRYSVYNLETGKIKTIVNGLPSWGEFLNAKPIFNGIRKEIFTSSISELWNLTTPE